MHLIRVFQGGEKAEQAESFIAALNDARNQIIPVASKVLSILQYFLHPSRTINYVSSKKGEDRLLNYCANTIKYFD